MKWKKEVHGTRASSYCTPAQFDPLEKIRKADVAASFLTTGQQIINFEAHTRNTSVCDLILRKERKTRTRTRAEVESYER